MIRKIIKIDENRCNGCEACVTACHEGAIGMVDGKAVLLRDDYCDGLGDCLPTCPTGAITFEEREAAAYDEAAVLANQAAARLAALEDTPLPCGCSGSNVREICHEEQKKDANPEVDFFVESRLSQWPVQIKLVPVNAPYFQGADLLIAADCTAFAYGNFHKDFIQDRITLIGCPKLDSVDYSEKLAQIFQNNDIKSVTVTRMEVPCCTGIENAVKNALHLSGKYIPLNVVTVKINGTLA